MRKIFRLNLVTGATGIIGSHVLLSLLQKEKAVVACKQKSSDVSKVETLFSYYTNNSKELFNKIKWVDIDLNDTLLLEQILEGIETVYHCAGFVSFNKHHRKKLFEINEIGTKNLVNACLHLGVKAFCHVSSISTINNLDYKQTLNEEVFWKTSGKESDYAISKYGAEKEVWRAMAEGLNAVVVNPGVVLSPGFWNQSSSKLFSTCYRGTPFYTTGTTAYVAAQDVAEAMLLLVEQKKFNARFILAENNYSFKFVLDTIHQNFNKKIPSIKAGKPLLKIAQRLNELYSFFTGKEPIITKALINSAFNTQLYSGNAIINAISFKYTPIEVVLKNTCEIYAEEAAQTKPTNFNSST